MSFGPSVRSDRECTTAPITAEVGMNGAGVVGGVSAAVSSSSTVPAGAAGPSCGSPHRSPRTTVQRMDISGGDRNGSTAADRGYSASASATPTAADVPKGATHRSPTPPPPSNPPWIHAPVLRGASEGKTSSVKLPVLTRTTPARASSILHDVGASATTSASSSSSTVVLPSVQSRHASISGAELSGDEGGSANRSSSRWTNVGRPNGTLSPIGARAAAAQLPSLSTTASGQCPSIGAEVAAAAGASGWFRVDASNLTSGSPSQEQRESYFRKNNIPSLFNELSEDLLDAQPKDPVSFMKEWLQRRREAIAQ
nr:unnamed protein product [Leishmania braziliensis]